MFDTKAFLKVKFTPRTKDVKVPGMAAFFGDSEPVWQVRGLTGEEHAKVDEAAQQSKDMLAIVEGMVSAAEQDKTEAVRELLGLSGEVPQELIKRHEMLTIASLKPKISREIAVKLAKVYPIEMRILTGTIMQLTGLGQQPGKLPGSGKTKKSEPPSPTAISGKGPSSK